MNHETTTGSKRKLRGSVRNLDRTDQIVALAYRGIKMKVFNHLSEPKSADKEKLLIALACTVAVNCESCIEIHTKEALKNGITMEEILEVASVAGLVCGGSGFSFASMVLKVSK